MSADPRQRRALRWTPVERVERLADAGTAAGALGPSGALWVGSARVHGRSTAVIASDVRVDRGALAAEDAARAAGRIRAATAEGAPIVWLIDSDGALLTEGLAAVEGSAGLLGALADARGHVPRVAVCHGLAGGIAAYALALCDVAIGIEDRSFTFVAGPAVVRAALGRDQALDALGGTALHLRRGTLAAAVPTDAQAVAWVRAYLAFLQPNVASEPPSVAELALPESRRAYDGMRVVEALLDGHSFVPLSTAFGPSVITGLGRLGGRAIAVVLSQPRALSGAIDADAAEKTARFLDHAVDLGLPILSLCDTPGFLPGADQERARVLAHGASLVHAYARARSRVATASVVLRRAVGAGAVLAFGSSVRLALPGATLVQMGERASQAAYARADAPEAIPFATVDASDLRHTLIDWLASHASTEGA